MIFALFCKAVLTGEVTVMGNVQAQCLDYSLALFEIADIFFIDVFCKQDIILRQLQNLLYRLTHLVVAVGQLLTGCLTLAASALLHGFLQVSCC